MKEKTEKSPELKHVLNNVKYHIKQSKLGTQAALARKIGMDPSVLCHSLNNNPTLGLLVDIADALEIPISRLVSDKSHIEGYVTVKGKTIHYDSISGMEKALKEIQKPSVNIIL